MKKYLYIVLLVGIWSCEDESEICDNTISDDAKTYADNNWSLQNWWNFTQSGPSRIEYDGLYFTDYKFREMRDFMGEHWIILNVSGELLDELGIEGMQSSDSLPSFVEYLNSPFLTIVKDSNFYSKIGKYEQFLGGWSDASSDWYWGLELSSDGDTSYVTAKTPKQQEYFDMIPNCK